MNVCQEEHVAKHRAANVVQNPGISSTYFDGDMVSTGWQPKITQLTVPKPIEMGMTHTAVIDSKSSYFTIAELENILTKCSAAPSNTTVEFVYIYSDETWDNDYDTVPEHSQALIQWVN